MMYSCKTCLVMLYSKYVIILRHVFIAVLSSDKNMFMFSLCVCLFMEYVIERHLQKLSLRFVLQMPAIS